MAELSNIVEKLKSTKQTMDRSFDTKDITFKAYLDNLDDLRSSTESVKANSFNTLSIIENLIKDAKEILEVRKIDLIFSFIKVKSRFSDS